MTLEEFIEILADHQISRATAETAWQQHRESLQQISAEDFTITLKQACLAVIRGRRIGELQ